MKKRNIYWKLATENGTYGLFFEEDNKDFQPNGENFSKGIFIEYLTEERKAEFDNSVRNEMKQLDKYNGTRWIEV